MRGAVAVLSLLAVLGLPACCATAPGSHALSVDGRLSDWIWAGAATWDDPAGDGAKPAEDIVGLGVFRDSDNLHFAVRMAGEVGNSPLRLTFGLALEGNSTVGADCVGLPNANVRLTFSTTDGQGQSMVLTAERWNLGKGEWEAMVSPLAGAGFVEGDTIVFSIGMRVIANNLAHPALLAASSGSDRIPDNGAITYDASLSDRGKAIRLKNFSFPLLGHIWIPGSAEVSRVWFSQDGANLFFRLDFNGTLDQAAYLNLPRIDLNLLPKSGQPICVVWQVNQPSSVILSLSGREVVAASAKTDYVRVGSTNSSLEGYFPLDLLGMKPGEHFDFDIKCQGIDRRIPEKGSLANNWLPSAGRDWALSAREDHLGFNAERANAYYWDEMPETEIRTDIEVTNIEGIEKKCEMVVRYVDVWERALGNERIPVAVPASGSVKVPIRLKTTARGYIAAYYSLEHDGAQSMPEQRITFGVIPRADWRKQTVSNSILSGNIYWADYIVGQGKCPGGAEIARRYGFKGVRYQIPWRVANPAPGKYDWTSNALGHWPMHPALDALASTGLRVTGKIWGSPPWQLEPGLPWHYPPKDDKAYADFLPVLFNEVGDQIHEWFVWNEQNAARGTDPATGRPNGWEPERFVKFLANAHDTIKKLRPHDKVMWNVSYHDQDYIEDAYKAGAMAYTDVQGLHYVAGTLNIGDHYDDVAMPFYRVRRLMDQFGGRGKPMFPDETGLGGPGDSDYGRHLRATQPAKCIARVLSWRRGLGMMRISFQQFAAADGWPAAFTADNNRPKPLSCAFAVAAYRLDGGRYAGTLDLGPDCENHIVVKDGEPVLVAWVREGTKTVLIPAATSSATVMDMMGNERKAAVRSGVLKLDLTPEPVYVSGWQGPVWIEMDPTIFPLKFATLSPVRRRVEFTATVHNRTENAVRGRLMLESSGGVSIAPSVRRFEVKPGSATALSFTADVVAGAKPGTYSITAHVDGVGDVSLVRSPIRILEDEPLLHPVEATAASYKAQSCPSLAVDGCADTMWVPSDSAEPPTLDIRFDPAVQASEVVVLPVTTAGAASGEFSVELWEDGKWRPAGAHRIGDAEIVSVRLAKDAMAVRGVRLRFDETAFSGGACPAIREVYLTRSDAIVPIASSSAVKVSNAIDNDPLTPWIATYAPPQWLMLDLGRAKRMHSVRLLLDKEERFRPTGLRLQSYDESSGKWIDQFEFSGKATEEMLFQMPREVIAQRIRLVVTAIPDGVALRVGDISVAAE